LTGEMIVIQNVSRYCDDVYECVASNGVPPSVSRQMRVTVECMILVNVPLSLYLCVGHILLYIRFYFVCKEVESTKQKQKRNKQAAKQNNSTVRTKIYRVAQKKVSCYTVIDISMARR